MDEEHGFEWRWICPRSLHQMAEQEGTDSENLFLILQHAHSPHSTHTHPPGCKGRADGRDSCLLWCLTTKGNEPHYGVLKIFGQVTNCEIKWALTRELHSQAGSLPDPLQLPVLTWRASWLLLDLEHSSCGIVPEAGRCCWMQCTFWRGYTFRWLVPGGFGIVCNGKVVGN